MPELIFGAKFAAMALLIVQFGRSLLAHVLDGSRCGVDLRPGERNFVSISFGVAAVVLLAILLRSVGVYRWSTMVATMAVLTGIATFSSARARREKSSAGTSRWWAPYLLTAFVLFLGLSPETYPEQPATAAYVLQGFDLFQDKDPAAWPYFGELVRMPLLFVTHAIGVTFNLFSIGNPYRFYLDGLFWANVLLAPLAPIGAYLFFRRKFGWLASLLLAAAFCTTILRLRTWSVRGETLGWIVGFAFLIAVDAVITAFATRGASWRTAFLLAPIYGVLALTHGICAFVATIIAGTLLVYAMVSMHRDGSSVAAMTRAGAAFVAVCVVLGVSYLHAFSDNHTVGASAARETSAHVSGEQDAAVLFEDALLDRDRSNAPATRAAPPYIEPLHVAQFSAFLPVAALFRPALAGVSINGFPDNALAKLEQISWTERVGYIALLLGCVLLWRRLRPGSDEIAQMFVVSVAVYVAIVAFCLWLNAQSTSIFPLAASRRLYPYALFFFWVAVILTIADLAARALPFWRRSVETSPALVARGARTTLLVAALPVGMMLSIEEYDHGLLMQGGWARRLHERRAVFETVRPASTGAVTPAEMPHALRSFRNLFAAMDVIAQRTHQGEYVYVNMLSDNQFWYLSNGRMSLLEGSAMYQVYGLQRPAADRIQQFRQFARTGDLALLGDRSVRLVLLHKRDECVPPACFGFAIAHARLDAFSGDPRFERVMENDDFVAWAVRAAP